MKRLLRFFGVGSALLLLLLFPVLVGADEVVDVPPGAPLEWGGAIEPVPTGGRRGKDASTEGGENKQPEEQPAEDDGGTAVITEEPPPVYELETNKRAFAMSSFNEMLKFISTDMEGHYTPDFGDPKKVDPPIEPTTDVVETGPGSGGPGANQNLDLSLRWGYMPPIPRHLVWLGLACDLRCDQYPGIVSKPEIAAYCAEYGYPTLSGAQQASKGGLSGVLSTVVSAPSASAPSIPNSDDPLRQVFHRFAVVELTARYAGALDPAFAHTILALREDAQESVIACSQSGHNFLKRNAVSVLAYYETEEATDALLARVNDGDGIARIRAMKALLRKQEQRAVPAFISMMNGGNEVYACMAAYGLGILGGKEATDALIDKVESSDDADLLFAALRSIPRVPGRVQDRIDLLKKKRGDLPQGDKTMALEEMIDIGLAALGDQQAKIAFLTKWDKSEVNGFLKPSQNLAIDALSMIGDEGVGRLAKLATNKKRIVPVLRGYAVRRLSRVLPKAKHFKNFAVDPSEPTQVRSAGIDILLRLDEEEAFDACEKILKQYCGTNKKKLTPGNAYITQKAMEILSASEKMDPKLAEKVVKKAIGDRAYAAVSMFTLYGGMAPRPPVLETACRVYGDFHTPNAKSDLLVAVLKSDFPFGRGEAALALRGFGLDEDGVKALVAGLKDRDGWIRFCCYLALKKISGKDFFCDYIFGDKADIQTNTNKYEAWMHSIFPDERKR